MKQLLVNKNDSGKRLDKFINKIFPNLPESLIYKYVRKKRIKVNNKKFLCSQRVNQGDIVQLYVNDELLIPNKFEDDFKNAPTNLDIIYEDENILLVNKKPGLIVHPDENYQTDCLINRIKNYLFKKCEYIPETENSFSPALVNRIDRNTSGIVIAAKNAVALRILNEKMKNREIEKSYICIVCGNISGQNKILKAYLDKNHSQNKVYVKNSKNPKDQSKTILTEYSVISTGKNFSLLKVKLLTGRTHQIRAHMAAINHPLLGDGKYGSNSINKKYGYKYQALCSCNLKFNFKNSSETLDYLDGKEFEVPNDKIWFIKDFYENLM